MNKSISMGVSKMKQVMGLSMVVVVSLSLSGPSFGAAPNLGNSYRWTQFTKATINDWTKVGSVGHETYFELPSNVDNPNDIMDPYVAETNDTWLRVQAVPDVISALPDTWAGYEWSVPDGVDEVIVSAWLPGKFNFNPSFVELRLTDTDGNVLFSISPNPGFINAEVVTPIFTPVNTIRYIAYVTGQHNFFGSNNNIYTNPTYMNTADGADFDIGATVDGADFLTWQLNAFSGTTHSQGDANLDGTVDGLDLDIWKNQYGNFNWRLAEALANSGALATVPEPTSILLVSLGCLLMLSTRRHDR